jgi:hypothetical protein
MPTSGYHTYSANPMEGLRTITPLHPPDRPWHEARKGKVPQDFVVCFWYQSIALKFVSVVASFKNFVFM